MNTSRRALWFAAALAALATSLSAAAQDVPETYEARFQKATELRLAGKTRQAVEIFNQMLEKNPGDVDALVGRGFCRLRDGKLDRALADFQKAIAASPSYVDAYVGASTVHRRQGRPAQSRAILDDCARACADRPKSLKYLAESAWREGHFKLARALDARHPRSPGRILVPRPNTVYLSWSHDWPKYGDDWDAVGFTFARRERPDLSWSLGAREYRRYGTDDFDVSAGATYRPRDGLGISYGGIFSDDPGFLAEQKHRFGINADAWRGAEVDVGADLSYYDGPRWSRRGLLGLRQNVGNWFARGGISAGQDSNDKDVFSYSLGAGYEKESRYAISISFSKGNETIEIERADGFVFRDDDVRSLSLQCRYYFNPEIGVMFGGSHEWRNGEDFRDGVSLALFTSFPGHFWPFFR
ncbi:MAG TPA: hypothetical protein DCM68_07520 [Verrucomicrobia bacterium]|nr:hypothetical protein [Verrucomicrobiota bacterium]